MELSGSGLRAGRPIAIRGVAPFYSFGAGLGKHAWQADLASGFGKRIWQARGEAVLQLPPGSAGRKVANIERCEIRSASARSCV
jgi:hypothetical protein